MIFFYFFTLTLLKLLFDLLNHHVGLCEVVGILLSFSAAFLGLLGVNFFTDVTATRLIFNFHVLISRE